MERNYTLFQNDGVNHNNRIHAYNHNYQNKNVRHRRRRKTYVKYIKIASILTCLAIILTIAMVFFTPKNVKADETVYYKYFQFYKVESGDTLWSLAKEYTVEGRDINDYIKEVVNSNHIKNNKIVEGEIIILPYYLTYIQ